MASLPEAGKDESSASLPMSQLIHREPGRERWESPAACAHLGSSLGLRSCQVKAGEGFEGEMQRLRDGWGWQRMLSWVWHRWGLVGIRARCGAGLRLPSGRGGCSRRAHKKAQRLEERSGSGISEHTGVFSSRVFAVATTPGSNWALTPQCVSYGNEKVFLNFQPNDCKYCEDSLSWRLCGLWDHKNFISKILAPNNVASCNQTVKNVKKNPRNLSSENLEIKNLYTFLHTKPNTFKMVYLKSKD